MPVTGNSNVGRIGAVVGAAAMLVGLAATPTTVAGSPEGLDVARQAAATPRLLVELAIGAPDAVDVAPDGTIWVAEAATGRVVGLAGDGALTHLRPSAVPAPSAVAVADDGSLVVGGGAQLARVGTDGSSTPVEVTGVSDIDAVDIGADGTIYLTDPPSGQVLQVAPDGTQSEVGFTGLGAVRGIDVDDAGTVSVLDTDADDVIQRTSGGAQSAVGFTTLADPVALDVADDRIAVAQPGSVVVREGDGTEAPAAGLEAPDPTDVHLGPDGTVLEAYHPATGGRSPSGPGAVARRSPSGTVSTLPLGDVSAFGSLSAPDADAVLFTSYQGAPGYSDVNPLRKATDAGATDVPTAGVEGQLVAAAPDGTIYRATQGPAAPLRRIAPDGQVDDVPLPTEPGMDAVVDAAVDGDGRLFVALGSGYGSGTFAVVEPYASGGPRTWYRYDGVAGFFDALAVGNGRVVLSATVDQDHVLLAFTSPGEPASRIELSADPVDDVAVDGDGAAFLLRAGAAIDRVAADGTTSPITYDGQRVPRSLAIGPEGTLYVGDEGLGLVALEGLAAPATEDGPPAATPIPGRAGYTG